jgi:hypothetical protein
MTDKANEIQTLRFTMNDTQIIIEKAMSELREKYPDVKFFLTENTYDDSAYGRPITVFNKIEIKAVL